MDENGLLSEIFGTRYFYTTRKSEKSGKEGKKVVGRYVGRFFYFYVVSARSKAMYLLKHILYVLLYM